MPLLERILPISLWSYSFIKSLCGGIGRRSRFRIYRLTVCRFESDQRYNNKNCNLLPHLCTEGNSVPEK